MTPAYGGDSVQMNEDNQHRNMLDVQLTRTSERLNGETVKAPIMYENDLSEFFFDILKLKVEDCQGIAPIDMIPSQSS